MASHMTRHEREDFRQFCRNASGSQLQNILHDEKERAEREAAKDDDSDYYETCARIAQEEIERRDNGCP